MQSRPEYQMVSTEIILSLLAGCFAQAPSPKRGVAWALQEQSTSTELKNGPFGWWYDWYDTVSTSPMTGASFTYVPTIQHKDIDQFKQAVAHSKPQYAIGFNEPDNKPQTDYRDISVDEFASMWNQAMPKLRSEGTLVASPSPIYGTTDWLGKFIEACDCDWDYSNLHKYTKSVDDLRGAVAQLYAAFKKPVWVTEFACLSYDTGSADYCNDQEAESFMKEALDFLDGSDMVAAYSWEGFNTGHVNRLVNEDGSLTNLGKIYSSH